MRSQFGAFTFDTDRRQLFRGAEELHLSPKAFRLLQMLIEKRPKAIAKNDIHDEIWPSTFVSESNLAGLIAELRAALDDRAREPQFIRTLHGFGYAFCGELTEAADAAQPPGRMRLQLLWEGHEAQLFEGANVLGRDPGDTISLDDPTISRKHARIEVTGESTILIDNGSKNGTFLNGTRITEEAQIRDGDVIHIGAVKLLFRRSERMDSTITIGESNRR
ncbi:MAG TPA: FHA domain-containing protein [Thermoanaerobaculia bacterium]|nr:FHA domain-containing protein [Thermoanaerobaculia bacterium]